MGRGSLQPHLPPDAGPPGLFAGFVGAVAAGPPTRGAGPARAGAPKGAGEPGAGGSWPDTRAPTAAERWDSSLRGLRSRTAPAGDSRGRPILLRAYERVPGKSPRLLRSPLRIPRSSRENGQNPLFLVKNSKEGG